MYLRTVHTNSQVVTWPDLLHAGFVEFLRISCDLFLQPSVPLLNVSCCTCLETKDLLSQDRHQQGELLLCYVVTHLTLYMPHTVHIPHCTCPTLYTPHTIYTPHCTHPTLYAPHNVDAPQSTHALSFPVSTQCWKSVVECAPLLTMAILITRPQAGTKCRKLHRHLTYIL